jgi:hypothetical protein
MTFVRMTKMRNLKWQYLLESITIMLIVVDAECRFADCCGTAHVTFKFIFSNFCIKMSNKLLNEVENISNICHYCPIVE